MIEIRRILVPTDFSENAARAYPFAAEFARRFDAEVLVLHIAETPIYPSSPSQVMIAFEEIEAELAQFVDAHLAKARDEFGPDLRVRTMTRKGAPLAGILATATEEDVELIVLATHGHSGITHLMLGSTTEKLVRSAPCPVLTVHPGD